MAKKNNDFSVAKLSGKSIKAVVVTWLDAVGSQDRSYAPFPCMTIGYVAKDEEDHIVMAHEIDADGDLRDFVTIPKSLIRAAQLLTVKIPQLVFDYNKKEDRRG